MAASRFFSFHVKPAAAGYFRIIMTPPGFQTILPPSPCVIVPWAGDGQAPAV